jgi:ABC-type branched-subunit amino acid transport system permease subunit
LVTTGHSLVALHDWTFLLGPGIMPAVNALCIGTVMYRTRLVPRIIPTIGLIAAPILLASTTATLFGAWDQVSGPATLFALPIATWELSFGVWMALKGFKPSAVADLPTVTTTPSARISVAA